MLSPPSVKDIILYIRRRNKVLTSWGTIALIAEINNAIDDECIFWTSNEKGELSGVGFGRRDIKHRSIHAIAIDAVSKRDFAMLLRKYNYLYHGWRLTAKRRGKDVIYRRPDRLYNLVVRLYG